MTKIEVRKRQLNRNLKKILVDLKKYKPEKIILYGSLACGKINESSDIDLLIIKKTRKKPLDRIGEVLNMCDYDVAFEPLIYTPREIKERLGYRDFFIKNILKSGKILYERKSSS